MLKNVCTHVCSSACVLQSASKVFAKAYVNPVLTTDKLLSLTLCYRWDCCKLFVWVFHNCAYVWDSFAWGYAFECDFLQHNYCVCSLVSIPSKLLVKQMFEFKISDDLWWVFKLKIVSAFRMKFIISSKWMQLQAQHNILLVMYNMKYIVVHKINKYWFCCGNI